MKISIGQNCVFIVMVSVIVYLLTDNWLPIKVGAVILVGYILLELLNPKTK